MPGTGQIPWIIAIFVVLAVVFGVVLHATPPGRSIFAMGNNAEAALFAGIRVKRIKTGLFVVVRAGLRARRRALDPPVRHRRADNGLGAELNVVAIVLLGGVSIFGGKGSTPRRGARRASRSRRCRTPCC